MKASMEMEGLCPVAAKAEPMQRAVDATVRGDLHGIGKNMVLMMLEGTGLEIFDLGVQGPPQRGADAVKVHSADLVYPSALPTITMPAMRDIRTALETAGLHGQVRVLAGGAPLNPRYADGAGADGCAAHAASAADVAKAVVARFRERPCWPCGVPPTGSRCGRVDVASRATKEGMPHSVDLARNGRGPSGRATACRVAAGLTAGVHFPRLARSRRSAPLSARAWLIGAPKLADGGD